MIEHGEIEAEVIEAVRAMLEPALSGMDWYDFHHMPCYDGPEGRLEVWCKQKADAPSRTLVLRLVFRHDRVMVGIPNIFMPESMKHERLGKRTIKAIFDACYARSYYTLVVDLVPSFRNRLLARGAHPINHEIVQITPDTNLTRAV